MTSTIWNLNEELRAARVEIIKHREAVVEEMTKLHKEIITYRSALDAIHSEASTPVLPDEEHLVIERIKGISERALADMPNGRDEPRAGNALTPKQETLE